MLSPLLLQLRAAMKISSQRLLPLAPRSCLTFVLRIDHVPSILLVWMDTPGRFSDAVRGLRMVAREVLIMLRQPVVGREFIGHYRATRFDPTVDNVF